jgi:ribosomal protein L7/L12
MTRITITNWEKGLSKVQLNHLLREYAGYGLREAKDAVDQLLSGEAISFELADPESATDFCRSARAIGAVCHAATEPQECA